MNEERYGLYGEPIRPMTMQEYVAMQQKIWSEQLRASARRTIEKVALLEDNVIPQPHPFKVTYFPAENYWELFLPEPMSLNDMYVTVKKGKGAGKRFLDNRAKMWKEKVRDAINDAWIQAGEGILLRDESYTWDSSAPMMYQMDWYIRNDNRKNDLDGRQKLLMDALSDSAVWVDDKQVQSFYARKVSGSMYKGAIRVIVMPYNVYRDNECLHPWLNSMQG